MIRFGCPTCKTVLEAAKAQRGAVIACPKCQQKLRVPTPTVPLPLPAVPLAAPPAAAQLAAVTPPSPQAAPAGQQTPENPPAPIPIPVGDNGALLQNVSTQSPMSTSPPQTPAPVANPPPSPPPTAL